MLDRRTFLTAGLTLAGLAGAGAALVATRRFDDVARLIGIDAPRYQDEADFALLDDVAADEAELAAVLRTTAAELDDEAFAPILAIADEHLRVLQASTPPTAPVETIEVGSLEDLRGRLNAAIAARRADVSRARAPEFAALLASIAAAHAQQQILLDAVEDT